MGRAGAARLARDAGAGRRRGAGPGAALARAVADRILCAASLADSCGDEPALIAAYGTEVGELVRRHMPMLALRAGVAGGAGRLPPLPQHRVRRRRGEGLVHRTERDCRSRPSSTSSTAARARRSRPKPRAPTAPASAPATSTSSTGPTTPTRRPSAGCPSAGRRATTKTTGRASSSASAPTAASTSAPPPTTATTTTAAPPTGPPTPASSAHDGWGPATHMLLVSGGSHAGNAIGIANATATPPAAASTSSRSSLRPPSTTASRSRRPG